MTPAAEATRRWKQTEKGRESVQRYEQSEKGRATRRRNLRAWKARNTEAVRNHNRILQRVRYHVSRGYLTKTACLTCGADRVQAHHHNGYAPEHELDVVWLCSRHHADAHRAMRAEGA